MVTLGQPPLKVGSLNIGTKSLDIGQWRDDFSSRPIYMLHYWSESCVLPYKTFLKRENHEKSGPEVQYRLYLDDLGRF